MAKKLLVADDSLTIQKVIKLALSGDGYEIQTVSDGNECLQQISLFRPDVVLIDIGIPGRTAFDLKKAANEDPDMARTPFVLMSSAFEKVDEAKVALLRFDGRLTKPFDPSNLKSVLSAALQMNSGQTIKEFVPSAPPNTAFSLDPSDRSRQTPRPSFSDNEATGEIHLMDPKQGANFSNPAISNPKVYSPAEPLIDPLWSDTPASDNHYDADIRNLTESTVKMSGLDDLGGWNIEEGAKSSLPPIPDMFTNTGLSQPTMTHPALSQSGLTMPPEDDYRLDLEIGSPTPTSPSIPMPPRPPSTSHLSAAPFSNPISHGASDPMPSSSQTSLENMVAQQVREQLEVLVQGAVKTQLEQMARKALPEIAERVVKAEIRKMLEGLAGSND